jgi:Mitochondrial ATP synthase B chain precursor (ATP-synt_B)
LITKTGTAILGSGLLATAISQELYVFNEETVIAVGYFILFGYIAKVRRFLFPLSSSSSSRHTSDHLYATVPGVGREILSITPLFLLVALFREFRDRKELIETCHTHRPFACHTKSGPRATLLVSEACSMVRVQNTRRP